MQVQEFHMGCTDSDAATSAALDEGLDNIGTVIYTKDELTTLVALHHV